MGLCQKSYQHKYIFTQDIVDDIRTFDIVKQLTSTSEFSRHIYWKFETFPPNQFQRSKEATAIELSKNPPIQINSRSQIDFSHSIKYHHLYTS